MDYIDLSRRFRDLTESDLESPELLASLNDSRWAAVAGMSVGWAELLEHSRVLVLAEAGSGKTAEMQAQADRLRTEGQPAFFVELTALDRDPLSEILSCQENRDLDTWKSEGQSAAWFFLDAVDELKLTQGTLEFALNRFAKAIDGHLHRVHCVISCRPSDFRRSVDLAIVRDKLPIIPNQPIPRATPDDAFLAALRKQEHGREAKKKANVDVPRIVVLLPLSEDQIVAFADSLGAADTAAMIEEIRRRDAWTFARRPMDLINLVASWNADKRLGTRAMQHYENVKSKLKDKPGRRDSGVLSDERARSGAERLALALALTHTRTIQSPEQTLVSERAEGVLDPEEILTDWTPEERQTLLRRALFDPATYGRVRFHHRSVQEYLAACRLKNLSGKGMPVKSLHRLLFAEFYGVLLVRPSMQAIAAWLALWNDGVRRELMTREPETLLSMGDPESLPIDARACLLREFAAAYGIGGWRGLNIPMEAIWRLADPELAAVVRELWGAGPSSPDVKRLLLEIIWQGPIAACADIANVAALDVNQPDDLRVTAITALVACGDLAVSRELSNSILYEPERWPDGIIPTVAIYLFPSALSVAQLITLVQRTHKPTDTGRNFSWAMRRIVEVIEPLTAVAIELRDALADLIWQGRHEEQDSYHFQGRFDHVAPALALLCERQLEATSSMPAPEARLIWACIVADRFGADETGASHVIQNLKKHFQERTELREAAFWSEFNLTSEVAQTANSWRLYHQAMLGSIIDRPIAADWAWLLDALRNSRNYEHRLVALHALMSLWIRNGREDGRLEELMSIVQGEEPLTTVLLQRSALPEPDPVQTKWARKAHRQKLVQEGRERQRNEKWLSWRNQLVANTEAAFTAEELPNTTWNLYQWLEAPHRDGFTSFSVWNVNAMREAFGEDITSRATKAFQEFWRRHPPILKSQRPLGDRERILGIWCEGLTGLDAESSIPGWAARLTGDEARIAAAYATIEFNGFPGWLRDLTAAHPKVVDEVIGSEVSIELVKDDGSSYLSTLQNLSRDHINLKRLLAPRLLIWLPNWRSKFLDDKCSRQSDHHLRQVLGILNEVAESQERDSIAQVCSRRFADNPDGPLALTWLQGLFQTDPERATQVLEDRLESLPEQERSACAVATLSHLFGGGGTPLAFSDDGRRAVTLDRLVRSAYRYVRLAEDRESESHVSDVRADAERAREFLLMTLLDTPGPAARKAILDLADSPHFAHYPDRLRLFARKRAASDAESPPSRPEDVVALDQRYEAPPRDRDGLFSLMVDRLDDLAHDLAHHPFTNRRTLQNVKDEIEMQRNLARSLEAAENGAYKVSRENEVADRKRTDIQLAATYGDQKAVIEVKIANRWSLRQLEHALRAQLVGQYLRHTTCRAGCLLLTYHKKKYWQHHETGRRLNFPEIIKHLKSLAQSIEEQEMHKVRLTVFPLDLTDTATESKMLGGR
jgi:hypothetical protein